MKIYLLENEYHYNIYIKSKDIVNRYIHLYGINLKNSYNESDLGGNGIYYSPGSQMITTIINDSANRFNIPLIKEIRHPIYIRFFSSYKNKGSFYYNTISIAAPTIDLINLEAYKETLESIKSTFIHEVAHLLEYYLHENSPSMVSVEKGGKYIKGPPDDADINDPKIEEQLKSYLDQPSEINAHIAQAFDVVGTRLETEFKRILKNELDYLDYFVKNHAQNTNKSISQALKFILEHDFSIEAKKFVVDVVHDMNVRRAKAAGFLFDLKKHSVFDLTERQEKYIYKRAYPLYIAIYKKYEEKIINILKNKTNEN